MEQSSAVASQDIDQIVREHQSHNDKFYNGDPDLDAWVHDDSVSLHGGFGFTAIGWPGVRSGLINASSRLSEGQMRYNHAAGAIAGDFAHLVGTEEGSVRVDGGEHRPMRLKVTTVLRRVEGRWRCVHRHGEMLR
ncbi:MAG TPA: nuclear transport factor 2 family protein [Candidatus Dormibacteraeota bacterium]|jgi:ketosteroid isomerase-like protein|nr:nuclear transport factor 2 family protein [Candidatus Dormibacteraeota bacterium]